MERKVAWEERERAETRREQPHERAHNGEAYAVHAPDMPFCFTGKNVAHPVRNRTRTINLRTLLLLLLIKSTSIHCIVYTLERPRFLTGLIGEASAEQALRRSRIAEIRGGREAGCIHRNCTHASRYPQLQSGPALVPQCNR